MNKYTHVDGTPFTKEEFLEKLETDTEFNDEFGNKGIDQISELIEQLKENPDSRRLMVNAWAVHDLPYQVLPPCHYGFQVYTRELNEDERYELCAAQKSKMTAISEEDYIKYNIPKRAISLMWNQRSCDLFLGIPFNIASYGLLLEIIAKEVNMVPEDLIGNLGDVHLYNNHLEQAAEQCSRTPYELPKLNILHNPCKDVEIEGHKTDISHYNIMDFQIENYQSHPSIKAPLSN